MKAVYSNVHDLTQVRRALAQISSMIGNIEKTLNAVKASLDPIANSDVIKALLLGGDDRQTFSSFDGIEAWRNLGALNGTFMVGKSSIDGGDRIG